MRKSIFLWKISISVICFILLCGISVFYYICFYPLIKSRLFLFINFDLRLLILLINVIFIFFVLIFGLLSPIINNIFCFMVLSIFISLLSVLEFYTVFYLLTNHHDIRLKENSQISLNHIYFHYVEEEFKCCGTFQKPSNKTECHYFQHNNIGTSYTRIPTCSQSLNNWFRITQRRTVNMICISCLIKIIIGFILMKVMKIMKDTSLDEHDRSNSSQ